MSPYSYDTSFDPPAPVLPVWIGIPFALLSPVVMVKAFVDSGADISVIPAELTRQLPLRRVATALVTGFAGTLEESPLFSVQMTLEEKEPRVISVVAWQEDYALLGRDLLNLWRVTLDGPQEILDIAV